jgi:excinuclease UvrABC helicase subunit UvrB
LEGIGGVGASFLVDMFSTVYPDAPIIKTGELMREMVAQDFGEGEEIFEEARRDFTLEEQLKYDAQLDINTSNKAKKLVEDHKIVIVDSKAAAVLFKNAQNVEGIETQDAFILNIGVKTNPQTAIRRMIQRQIEKGEVKKPKNIFQQAGLFIKTAIQRHNRLKGDRKIFTKLYPQIKEFNPLNRDSLSNIMHIVVDRTNYIPKDEMQLEALRIINQIVTAAPTLLNPLLNEMSDQAKEEYINTYIDIIPEISSPNISLAI